MIRLDFGRLLARPPVIESGPLIMRAAELGDYQEWMAIRQESRTHLTRWEPDWRDEDVTLEAFRTRLRLYERQHRARAGLSLYVRLRSTGALIGGVTLSDILLHASHSATIGYWIGERHLRKGYGLAAVFGLVEHAFREMGLNRVEAACQPGNESSRALLLKAGFREEGCARDYLHINGAWRDHLLFAAIARDFCGATADPRLQAINH